MELLIPVSPGELLDKLSILEIKLERIDDQGKLINVRREHELLSRVWRESGLNDGEIDALRRRLREVNESLWEIEDAIRDEEREKRFGDRFVELARSVYLRNDERAALKKRVNEHLGSEIVEEKSYRDYR
jgi:chaperonin cofactor prefoldin